MKPEKPDLPLKPEESFDENLVQTGTISYSLSLQERGSRILSGVVCGLIGILGADTRYSLDGTGIDALALPFLCITLIGFFLCISPGMAQIQVVLSSNESDRVVELLPDLSHQGWRDRIGYTEIAAYFSIFGLGLVVFNFDPQSLSLQPLFLAALVLLGYVSGKSSESSQRKHLRAWLSNADPNHIQLR